MSKKLSTLISVGLLLVFGGVVQAEVLPLANGSFEYLADGTQILGHTGMEEIAGWINVGNWIGVDTYCPYAEWTPDHCWDIGGEVPDGINICYTQHGKIPPIYFYQVVEHDISAGELYFVKFDAMAMDDLYYDVVFFYDDGDGLGHADPNCEIARDVIYIGPQVPGLDNLYSPDGEVVWGYGPDAFDKMAYFISEENAAYTGKKLGIKFYCTGGDSTQYYWGWIDNVRLYRQSAGMAWAPNPKDRNLLRVSPDLGVLSWSPGLWAAGHDVYLGVDFDSVSSAETSSEFYKGRQDSNSYELEEVLIPGQDYYWRIDEVNGSDLWKGEVWSFKVADYLVVDDFDSYADNNSLREVWKDWRFNDTGASITLENGSGPGNDDLVRYGGSLCYEYSNVSAPYYSEASAFTMGLQTGPCWLSGYAEALVLWFRGDEDNVAEPMWISLEDVSGNVAAVLYEGPAKDISREKWQQWVIELEEFVAAGVDLTNVAKIYIGFGDKDNPQAGGYGTVYFEDIRLYPADFDKKGR